MRYSLMEWAGVGLVAVACGLVYVPLGLGVVGAYLFGAAVVAQALEGRGNGEEEG